MHIFYRILVLVGLIMVAISISFAFINPHSFCGTGDAITIFFFTLIASAIWIVYLNYRSYFITQTKSLWKEKCKLTSSSSSPFDSNFNNKDFIHIIY